MTCGLPTFATCNSGPSEIIKNGKSGFHIDPYHGDDAANLLADFFEGCRKDPGLWERISKAGLEPFGEACAEAANKLVLETCASSSALFNLLS